MISPRSLNKKKGAFYSFTSALKICAAPAGIISAIFILLMGVYPYFFLTSEFSDRLSRAENIKNLREQYKFFVFANDRFMVVFALFAAAGLSILMGILIFRFCADKKTVNVYYSLGIKRTTLFYSRFFAGQLCLSLAIIPGAIISYLINASLLGLSWQLSLILFYFYCGLTLFCLLCFSVTAAVFASVGTIYEGILFSVGLLGAPTVFEFTAGQILAFFLKHVGGNYFVVTFIGDYLYNEPFKYVENLSAYNPILFMYHPLYNYSVGMFSGGKDIVLNNEASWSFPDVTKVFIWLLVCLAAALLGGLWFFKRRDAENCGFLNTNKPLANLILFELLSLVGAFFFSLAPSDDVYTGLILGGLAVSFAVYIVYEILLKRNFNAIVKSLYKYAAHVAVFALICTVFALDLTGTDSYVPKSTDVEKAAVTSVADVSWISGNIRGYGGYSEWFITPVYLAYESYELPEFTEKTDIEKVISLHKEALEKEESEPDMNNAQFFVRYTLKDGREVIRKLNVSNKKLCDELLNLFDSETVKKARTDIIMSELPADAKEEDLWNSNNMQFTYSYSSVTAIAPSFTEGYKLNLTESEFNSLKKAVADDLNAMTAENYMKGSSRQIGVLRFEGEYSFNFEEELTFAPGDEEVSAPVRPGEDLPEDEYEGGFEGEYEGEEGEEEGEQQNEKMDKFISLVSPYAQYNWNSVSGENSYDVIITPEMTKTLSFLKSIGCENCFEQTKKIKSVSFQKFGVNEPWFLRDSNRVYEYFGGSVDPNRFYIPDMNSIVDDFSENVITNADKINELVNLMRIHSYTYNTGYGCLIAYDDGTYSTMYLSEENAPSYVKSYNYVGITDVYY